MIRNALLLCAALLAAITFACAPPPSAPTPSPGAVTPPSVRAAALPFNGRVYCSTISDVRELSASVPATADVDPDPNGYAPAAPSNMQNDLRAAYDAALSLQAQLCGLDKIFVTQGPESWGYRNITNGRRYIAISESLWNSAGPIPLDQYENRVFGWPLCWMRSPAAPCSGPPANDSAAPIYLTPTPNNGTMTLVAALAHEFGHVLWSDQLVYPRGTPAVSGRFCNKVLNEAWNNDPLQLQIPVWRGFEDTAGTDPADIPDDDPSDPPLATDPGKKHAKVLEMLNALNVPNFDHAHRILRRILAKPRPFPSLLGAFSANEQFVETFTLATLLRAGLTSLPLQVTPDPNDRIDIAMDIVTPPAFGQAPSRKRLRKVLSCFGYPP